MRNWVTLSGTIVQPKDKGKPAVRTIKSSTSGETMGFACRLRYETGTSIGYISATHWNPQSELAGFGASSVITIQGTLDQDVWTKDNGDKEYSTALRIVSVNEGADVEEQ